MNAGLAVVGLAAGAWPAVVAGAAVVVVATVVVDDVPSPSVVVVASLEVLVTTVCMLLFGVNFVVGTVVMSAPATDAPMTLTPPTSNRAASARDAERIRVIISPCNEMSKLGPLFNGGSLGHLSSSRSFHAKWRRSSSICRPAHLQRIQT